MPGSDPVSKTVSTLKSAYSLSKSIADLDDVHSVKVQIGELQAQILAAQESALLSQEREAALAEGIRNLEEKVAELEAWDAEKERYELTDFGGETFAYLLKPASGDYAATLTIGSSTKFDAKVSLKGTIPPAPVIL